MVMKRGIRFVCLFRHFNLTPVRNLDCTSSLQPAPVLLHLPVWFLHLLWNMSDMNFFFFFFFGGGGVGGGRQSLNV